MCLRGMMTASKGHYETFTELLPAGDPWPKNVTFIGSAFKVAVLVLAFLEHGNFLEHGCSRPEGRFS